MKKNLVFILLTLAALASCEAPYKKKDEEDKKPLKDQAGDQAFQAFLGRLRQAVALQAAASSSAINCARVSAVAGRSPAASGRSTACTRSSAQRRLTAVGLVASSRSAATPMATSLASARMASAMPIDITTIAGKAWVQ